MHIEQFPRLDSLVSSSGRIDAEVERWIAKASRVFGALCKTIFNDCNLNITTKQRVYEACVLTVLLYGFECWTPLHRHLSAFHHWCICTVLGITNRQQWKERISLAMTHDAWGGPQIVATKRRQDLGVAWPCSPHARASHAKGHTVWVAVADSSTGWASYIKGGRTREGNQLVSQKWSGMTRQLSPEELGVSLAEMAYRSVWRGSSSAMRGRSNHRTVCGVMSTVGLSGGNLIRSSISVWQKDLSQYGSNAVLCNA